MVFQKNTFGPIAIVVVTLASQFSAMGTAAAQDDDSVETDVDVNGLFEDAGRRVRRNQLARALSIYRQIVALEPTFLEAWFNLGEVSRVAGQFDDCLLYFNHYLYLDPTSLDRGQVERKMRECADEVPEGVGTLTITATPDNAVIRIGDLRMGRGTTEVLTLPIGTYTAEVSAVWYTTQSFDVDIALDQRVTHNITLVEETGYGSLEIDCNQAEATVLVEGNSVGQTPLAEPLTLEAGVYLITLTKPGYYDWVRRVEIERDGEVSLDVMMEEE